MNLIFQECVGGASIPYLVDYIIWTLTFRKAAICIAEKRQHWQNCWETNEYIYS